VTESVVGAIAPQLERAEIERAKRKPTGSLDAYDYYLHGMAHLELGTKESIDAAGPRTHNSTHLIAARVGYAYRLPLEFAEASVMKFGTGHGVQGIVRGAVDAETGAFATKPSGPTVKPSLANELVGDAKVVIPKGIRLQVFPRPVP
jgi:hypothetical protein